MSASLAWRRLGRVFRSEGQRPWMATHAQMPHAEPLDGSLIRVYFTCRNAQNQSRIAWFVTDLERPGEILDLAEEPLMVPGPRGSFDDAGVMSSWMVNDEGQRRFYVIGWNVKTAVPLHNSIGFAYGPSGDTPIITEKLAGPIFERNRLNPFYVSCPCVLRDGIGWRMWYLCGLSWRETSAAPASRYTVWHARSADGLNWTPDPHAALEFVHPGEMAIARPCVVRDGDLWRMWHCYRGEDFGYRVGYAESEDGETWTRRDADLGLYPSGDGFDADMTCYPFVFDQMGERWMLYSGNAFGQGGIGLARLERGAT